MKRTPGSKQKAEGRTLMKLSRFSFKTEAMWMAVFSFGLPVVALLLFLILALVRYFRPLAVS